MTVKREFEGISVEIKLTDDELSQAVTEYVGEVENRIEAQLRKENEHLKRQLEEETERYNKEIEILEYDLKIANTQINSFAGSLKDCREDAIKAVLRAITNRV